MTMQAVPLQVAKKAIQKARIVYPGYERDAGAKWPETSLDSAEAKLFAFAALRALDQAGYEVVKKADLNAPRP
jgi:hypothetical protein